MKGWIVMKIAPFAVEEWMNEYEVGAKYNIAETCVDSISLDELFELTHTDKKEFLDDICARRLTYGDIYSKPELLKGIASLYKTVNTDEIVTCHGAAGANHHLFYSIVEPGDRVISVMPTYSSCIPFLHRLAQMSKSCIWKKIRTTCLTLMNSDVLPSREPR